MAEPTIKLKYPTTMGRSDFGNTATMPIITFVAYKYNLPSALVESAHSKKDSLGTSIQLYMPAGTSERVGAEWGFESLMNIQSMGMAITGTASNLAKAAEEKAGKLYASISGNKGSIVAPSEFLIFKKPSPFNFNLSFNFVPRDVDEGKQMLLIIDTFKQMTLPTRNSDKDYILDFPPVWDIAFEGIKGPGSPSNGTNTYESMACTSVNVSYSGGANSALVFTDETPVQCQLQIQFQSIKYAVRLKKNGI